MSKRSDGARLAMQRALDQLDADIKKGREFPDAAADAATDHKVCAPELRVAYDER